MESRPDRGRGGGQGPAEVAAAGGLALLLLAASIGFAGFTDSLSGASTTSVPQEPGSRPPSLIPVPRAERARIRAARRLAAALSDEIWPGWSSAPFEILLVTPERELLIGRPEPPTGFALLGRDRRLESPIYGRKRQFSPTFEATFPAFDRTPLVVIGTGEATGKGPTEWVLTLLHEHFHQLQMSQPGYFDDVKALDLADGDESGMWMLNYPFPYDEPAIVVRFEALSAELGRALERSRDAAGLARVTAAYRRLEAALDAPDARYLAFQLWQEGVARYVELRLAELAADRFEPHSDLTEQAGYRGFAEVAGDKRRALVERLERPELAGERRVAFYPLGAALALLFDAAAPEWKRDYFRGPPNLIALAENP